jgi:N-acetylmuramoyl-L-alanine amidase
LTEQRDGDGNGTGTYTAVIVPARVSASPAPVRARLYETGAWFPREAESDARVEVWDPRRVRVGEATRSRAGITLGTHDVRLGGPYLADVPAGTRFRMIGRQGDKVHIRLADSLTGWIASDHVKELPIGTPPPRNHFTSCTISGDEQYDRLSVSLAAPVVVSVTPATEPTNHLYVDFFDTHFATTWISHRTGAQRIGTVTGSQLADGWFRLTVPVQSKQIWGYWTERDDRSWTLYVRRPPPIAERPSSPLAGLRIALEAGHGGRSFGAVGTMGTKEKTINRNAVDALKRVLDERGAQTIQVRPGDSAPSLAQRAKRANEAGADFYVSVHANAAGSAGGYLRVSGTSTYYQGPHCRRAAQRVYEALLNLGWEEFGVVGNFSYSPLRNSRTPAILIEQAFMSNPKDEARLLDPAYQQSQAVAVADALEAFFDEVRE